MCTAHKDLYKSELHLILILPEFACEDMQYFIYSETEFGLLLQKDYFSLKLWSSVSNHCGEHEESEERKAQTDSSLLNQALSVSVILRS